MAPSNKSTWSAPFFRSGRSNKNDSRFMDQSTRSLTTAQTSNMGPSWLAGKSMRLRANGNRKAVNVQAMVSKQIIITYIIK